MKKTKASPLLVLSSSVLATSMIGYGSWIIYKPDTKKDLSAISKSNERAVCFIGDTYYTSVEKALEVSSSNSIADTIYIIPGTNPRLEVNQITKKNEFTLAKEDTLTIAFYSDENSKTIYNNSSKADSINGGTALTLKNTLTIASGVTFKVYGTINVSGQISANTGGQSSSGHTYGSYTKLLLDSNSKVDNYGSINAYGYIEETSPNNGSKIEMEKGSSLSLPFVFRDFRGGASMFAIYSSKDTKHCCPFNQYEIKNLSCRTTLLFGSKIYGWVNLSANNGIQNSQINVLGDTDSFLFQLTDSEFSKVEFYHIPDTSSYKNDTSLKNHVGQSVIDFIGGACFNSLSLDTGIMGVKVNSAEYYFPLNYFFNFSFKNADGKENSSFELKNKMKIMPGCELYIGPNCTVNIEDIVIYNVYNDDNTNIGGSKYPSKEPGLLHNDGSINAKNFAGCVINDGSLTITGNRVSKAYEARTQSGSLFSAKITQWVEINANYSEFKSSETSKNKVLIYTKNVDNVQEAKYAYRNMSLTGNYTDYLNNGEGISLSDWSNISSIAINGQSYNEGGEYFVNSDIKIEITPTSGADSGDSGGCLLPSALILMVDGSFKRACDIKTGDFVFSFNHETGKLEPNVVIGNDDVNKPANAYNVVHLEFSNGQSTDFVYEHGYFDATLNRYVYMHVDDAKTFVDHEFICVDSNLKISRAKLNKVSVRKEMTKLAAPATANHLNLIVDNMLSMEGGLTGLFNIFEYDSSTLAFNKKKMDEDIQRYGLLGYESFEKYFPKEIYDLLPCKYLGVSIGKGLITWKIFEEYVNKWKDQLMENIK